MSGTIRVGRLWQPEKDAVVFHAVARIQGWKRKEHLAFRQVFAGSSGPSASCSLLICLQRPASFLSSVSDGEYLLNASALSGSLGEDRASEMLVVPTKPGTEALCRICCCLYSNCRKCSKLHRNSYVAFIKGSELIQCESSINQKLSTARCLYTTNNQHEPQVESSQVCAEQDACCISVS